MGIVQHWTNRNPSPINELPRNVLQSQFESRHEKEIFRFRESWVKWLRFDAPQRRKRLRERVRLLGVGPEGAVGDILRLKLGIRISGQLLNPITRRFGRL